MPAPGLMIPDSIAQWRMPDGSTIRLEDWVDKPVWSCADLESGFNDRTITLFTYTVGQEVASSANITTRRTATERDTNVQVGGTNASTEEILVFAIRTEVYFFGLTTLHNATTTVVASGASSAPHTGMPIPMMENLSLFNAHLTLRLMVSQKCYAEEGFGYFNAGFGPWGSAVIGSALELGSIRTYGNPGLPSDEAIRYYRMPHHIGGTEKYRVELKNYAGTTLDVVNGVGGSGVASFPLTSALHRVFVHLEGARKRPTA